MRRIGEVTGTALPATLRAFWEVVEGIDFVWNYGEGELPALMGVNLPINELDAVSIDPARPTEYLIAEWLDWRDDDDFDGVYALDVAPDALHKANISGGAPYGFALPSADPDPIFANEPHGLRFTEYLRLCFRFGGFPGLERHKDRRDVRDLVAALTQDLQPFRGTSNAVTVVAKKSGA